MKTISRGESPIATAEFFAGIGLVREALGPLGVDVVWANDIEEDKFRTYSANHDASHFRLGDVRQVRGDELPGIVELATSSFPCVDLSLAGNRKGLSGEQSGMFWEFARVIRERKNRPRVVLLENVYGFASSNDGADLRAALIELNKLGYSCDVVAIDARFFVPQSRPRMFVVGIRGALPFGSLKGKPSLSDVRPQWVLDVYARNSDLKLHHKTLPQLPSQRARLSTVIERLKPSDQRWWDERHVDAFNESLSVLQFERLEVLRHGPKTWRTAYRRTRAGRAVWEIRRDDLAGCLRTTGGGSSRQAVVEVGRGVVKVRWMTAREYARLMGAGNYYLQGMSENKARFGFGDAVVVDVVRWIGMNYLVPTLRPDVRGAA